MVAIIVRTEEDVSLQERAHLARALRLALAPFQPRVARAVLRLRRCGASWRVEARVPLGPSGVVRVAARDAALGPSADAAIRRVADAVRRRLSLEREELLEFLFLVNQAAGEWPPVSVSVAHRRTRDGRATKALRPTRHAAPASRCAARVAARSPGRRRASK